MIGFNYEKEPMFDREYTDSIFQAIGGLFFIFPLKVFSRFKPKNHIAWSIRGFFISVSLLIWTISVIPVAIAMIFFFLDVINDQRKEALDIE